MFTRNDGTVEFETGEELKKFLAGNPETEIHSQWDICTKSLLCDGEFEERGLRVNLNHDATVVYVDVLK